MRDCNLHSPGVDCDSHGVLSWRTRACRTPGSHLASKEWDNQTLQAIPWKLPPRKEDSYIWRSGSFHVLRERKHVMTVPLFSKLVVLPRPNRSDAERFLRFTSAPPGLTGGGGVPAQMLICWTLRANQGFAETKSAHLPRMPSPQVGSPEKVVTTSTRIDRHQSIGSLSTTHFSVIPTWVIPMT